MKVLLLVACLLTVGCGDDVVHPTYIPPQPNPPGATDHLCGVPDATGSRFILVPCD